MYEFEQVVLKTQELLRTNQEWKARYAGYAKSIKANISLISEKKSKFRIQKPFYLHMNIDGAQKTNPIFQIRYLGQHVANLKVGPNNLDLNFKGFIESNTRDFGYTPPAEIICWLSDEAKLFRKHFESMPQRAITKRANIEHEYESIMVTEINKSKRVHKHHGLIGIQPVKIANVARFQMKTPIKASDPMAISYAGPKGGNIDILARAERGGSTRLCIVELKPEHNKHGNKKALMQGIAYATFIRELLRSESGALWWNLFGFNRKLPMTLTLYVACAMPFPINSEQPPIKGSLKLDDNTNDSLEVNYIYFEEKEGKLLRVESSFE